MNACFTCIKLLLNQELGSTSFELNMHWKHMITPCAASAKKTNLHASMQMRNAPLIICMQAHNYTSTGHPSCVHEWYMNEWDAIVYKGKPTVAVDSAVREIEEAVARDQFLAHSLRSFWTSDTVCTLPWHIRYNIFV